MFVLGISESWSKNFVKKKQERLDKQEGINKKNNLEETKKYYYQQILQIVLK